MHRLNLTIDEALYEQARAFSFLENKSISQMIRESLSEYIDKNKEKKAKVMLLLEADDEKEILSILNNDSFSSENEFAKKWLEMTYLQSTDSEYQSIEFYFIWMKKK